MVVLERGEAPTGCGRTADVVDENVDAAEAIEGFADDFLRAIRGAEVSPDEEVGRRRFRSSGARGGDDGGSGASEAFGDGFAHAFGSTGDEDAFAGELVHFGREVGSGAHGYSVMKS